MSGSVDVEGLVVIRAAFCFYRVIVSPAIQAAFGIQCRYEESCSHYMERMLREHGFLRGTPLGVRRLLSCNTWSLHG